jgi:hypothetical protein
LSATIALLLPQLAAADVNDFSFESFDANYHLSVNEQSDNRSEGWGFESLQAHITQFLLTRTGFSSIFRDLATRNYFEGFCN